VQRVTAMSAMLRDCIRLAHDSRIADVQNLLRAWPRHHSNDGSPLTTENLRYNQYGFWKGRTPRASWLRHCANVQVAEDHGSCSRAKCMVPISLNDIKCAGAHEEIGSPVFKA